MTVRRIQRLLKELAYPRTGGSEEEKRCVLQLKAECEAMGFSPSVEAFAVDRFEVDTARLTAGEKEIPCRAYFGSDSATAKGKLFYLSQRDPLLFRKCKGKLVIVDGAMGKKLHSQLAEAGAAGFISLCGNMLYDNEDIDLRELRFFPENTAPLPGVIAHVKRIAPLLEKPLPEGEIALDLKRSEGRSHNLLLTIPGETKDTVTLCAHYDTTLHSQGSYDNSSGAIALLAVAEALGKEKHKKTLRLLWCGSEERGLLGSLSYCDTHPEELADTCLNVNLDMLGTAMGSFVSFSCTDERMAEVLERFARKKRFPNEVRHGIRSSDCVSFAYFGVPSVSFARYAPPSCPPIHTRYDTPAIVSAAALKKDADYVISFTRFVLNEDKIPQDRSLSETIRKAVADYAKGKKAFEALAFTAKRNEQENNDETKA